MKNYQFSKPFRCERSIINQGGTSSGKTYAILQVLIFKAITEHRKVITVVGQDIPNLKRGAIRDFQTIVSDNEILSKFIIKYNPVDRIYTFSSGSIIEFTSYSSEQDAKSGKRDYLFINEANGIRFEIFQQLKIRTRFQTFLDYNPSAKFWVHDYLIHKEGVQLFISNYKHNPFLPPEMIQNIESMKGNKTWWEVYGLGKTGKVEGLVFYNVNIIKESNFPTTFKKIGYGLDFGFTNDPTVLLELGVAHGEIYGREIIYAKGMTNQDIVRELKTYGVSMQDLIYADAAEPKSIEEIRRHGFRIRAARKGRDSILHGINLLKQYTINIDHNSRHWIEESERYIWQIKNGRSINKPIDNYNHCWDAARYWAVMMLGEHVPIQNRRIYSSN